MEAPFLYVLASLWVFGVVSALRGWGGKAMSVYLELDQYRPEFPMWKLKDLTAEERDIAWNNYRRLDAILRWQYGLSSVLSAIEILSLYLGLFCGIPVALSYLFESC